VNIRKAEFARRQEISEYLTTTHIFCLFVMMFAFALSNEVFVLKNYNTGILRYLIFFAVALSAFGLVTKYCKTSNLLQNRCTLTHILYISFPLLIAAMTLFTFRNNSNLSESILLLPIIIASSILGKKPGIFIAMVSVILLLIDNTIETSWNFYAIMQNNLILISVMFIVAWFLGAYTDLDTRYRLYLTKLASTDLLTGLYNYGYFQEKIKDYVQDASMEHPLSLIIIDIDYFKHYNDIHGHQAGDLLINSIGDILNSKVNSPGFASRYGGDEFVVVLPDTTKEKAMQMAQEISHMVNLRGFQGEEYQPEGKITISCGIAACPHHARDAKNLVKYADNALYRAKSLDKNKVEMYYSVFDNLDIENGEEELLNSIRTLVSVINAKDRYTFGHSERVTDHALKLASRFGLSQEQIHLLGYAAFLHDIGKIEIDRNILNKVEQLSQEEWQIIQHHSQWGSEIVKAVTKLHPIVPVILHHHENYDGSGYPYGLKGNEIPILSRIIRIADSFDAMVSHRVYKRRMTVEEALQELRLNSGIQFDPQLVNCFQHIIQEGIGIPNQQAG
jgi:diguanylate cyclase (GGDEF)-like protein